MKDSNQTIVKFHTENAGIVERIRNACKQPSDKALALFLGTTPSVISAWQHSKKPPYHGCYLASQKTGITMEWFISGSVQTGSVLSDLTIEQCCDAFKMVLKAAIELEIVDSSEEPERLEEKLQMLGEGYLSLLHRTHVLLEYNTHLLDRQIFR